MPLVNPVPVFDFTVFLTDVSSSSGTAAAVGAAVVGAVSGVISGSFAEVSGLNAEIEIEEYREGGRNTAPHKFIKWGKYPNLVFKRGVTPNPDLWDWYYQVLYGGSNVLRKNGLIVLTDRGAGAVSGGAAPALPAVPGLDRLPIAVWSFTNGLPEKMQGPGLNAKGNEIAIETLEIAHEGLTRLGAAMVPVIGDALASVGL